MAAYKQSMIPILVAILALVALSVAAILAVGILRPDQDNTNLLANLMSILLPSILAMLALLKSMDNATVIHDTAEKVESTKAIASESKVVSEENKAAIRDVGDRVNGKLAQLLAEARRSAHAEGVIEGLQAQLRGESAVVETAKPESGMGVNMAKAAPGMATKTKGK